MELYLKLLIIQIIVCYVVDLSGAVDHLFKPIIRRLLKLNKSANIAITPLDCSLCMGLYTNLFYALLTPYHFDIYVLFAIVLLSFFSKNITGFMRWVQELLISIENNLYKYI